MNLELITKQVANLSRAIGRFIKSELKNLQPQDIKIKGKNSLVTYVDKEAEDRIVNELHKILPEAGVIAEENPDHKTEAEFNWLIDPLDGTTNYIHQLPVFSISIALMKGNSIVSSVVYEINHQECFYAWKGGLSYLNGHEIRVSLIDKLERSLIATGFPYHDFSKLDGYISLFKHLMGNTHGIRRLGSAAVDLAYVACGRFDGFYEYGLNSWDVAAGSLIVEQAGGIVSDFKGEEKFIDGREIIASNPIIYNEFSNIVKKYLS